MGWGDSQRPIQQDTQGKAHSRPGFHDLRNPGRRCVSACDDFRRKKKPRRYRIFRSDSGAAWRIVTVRRRSPIPGGLRSLQQIVEQTIDGHIKLGVVFVLPAGDGFFHLRDLVDADVAVFGELEKMAQA